MKEGELAKALKEVFISPNVSDNNFEAANVVDGLDEIGRAIRWGTKWLGNGDACTKMGAIEAHGKAILDGSDKIASAIRDLAEAIRERG